MSVSRPQGSAFDGDSCSVTQSLDPDPSKCQREATVWTLTATSSCSWGSPGDRQQNLVKLLGMLGCRNDTFKRTPLTRQKKKDSVPSDASLPSPKRPEPNPESKYANT